ncbi:MAG: elongation factor 1-beta [Euryarchaeota archaeon]|nr:elongation factor 1-beta [Euryarchaeota archaeon]
MGDVAVTFRVMPNDTNVDLAKLTKDLSAIGAKVGKVAGVEETPIAFGLKAVHIRIIMKDAEGMIDKIEGDISALPTVQSIETVDMSLI